jgi:hypothetical protein
MLKGKKTEKTRLLGDRTPPNSLVFSLSAFIFSLCAGQKLLSQLNFGVI